LILGVNGLATAAETPGRVAVARDGAQVELSWDCVAGRRYQVESTTVLGNPWQLVATAPNPLVATGTRLSYRLGIDGLTRFYRVTELLEPTVPGFQLWLTSSAGPRVVAGATIRLEVRASHDQPLEAVSLRVAASRPDGSSAGAVLVGRSASPGQMNGLAFVSATSMRPFQSGLPMDLSAHSWEVLLNLLPPPHDTIESNPNRLLETLELVPTGTGTLTVSVLGVEAATSDHANPDGRLFDPAKVDPTRGSLAFEVERMEGVSTSALTAALGPGGKTAVVGTSKALALPSRTVALHSAGVSPNADGLNGVTHADLVAVRARLGADPSTWGNSSADVNHDGRIDLVDLIAVRNRLDPDPSLPVTEVLKLNEIGPDRGDGRMAWAEVYYAGSTSLSLSKLELRSIEGELIASTEFAGPINLQSKSWLLFFLDGPNRQEQWQDTIVVYHAPPAPNHMGAAQGGCALYADGVEVDRIVWGDVAEGRSQLNTRALPIPPLGTIGRERGDAGQWRRCAAPTPGGPNSAAAPIPRFPPPGAIMAADHKLTFAWVDFSSAAPSYRLQVARDGKFADLALDERVENTLFRVPAPLPPGRYYWRVRTTESSSMEPWSQTISFEVEGAAKLAGGDIDTSEILWFRTHLPLVGKDSVMVCLECGEIPGHQWDGPHEPDRGSCQHCVFAGPAAACAAVDHMYGGDITVDELIYSIVEFHNPGTPEGNLLHGSPVDAFECLDFALIQPEQPTTMGKGPAKDDWLDIKAKIRLGIPGVGGFAQSGLLPNELFTSGMIICGFQEGSSTGKKQIKQADPLTGSVFSLDWEQCEGRAHFPAILPGIWAVQRSRGLGDKDGDRLCDRDEMRRFGTDPDSHDSDDDEVDDKTEIWSYLFGKGKQPRRADGDGDTLRAELDPDSDNDSCLDGEEDKNCNGDFGKVLIAGMDVEFEGGETDPFTAEVYELRHHETTAKVAMGERLTIEWELVEISAFYPGGYEQVEDAKLEFSIVPISVGASFENENEPVVKRTDSEGKVTVTVRADKGIGSFGLRCMYMRCKFEKEAQVVISVTTPDWIFAVQEEAILNGARIEESECAVESQMKKSAGCENNAHKDIYRQTLWGRFWRDTVDAPGKYIRSVSIGWEAPETPAKVFPVLRIDGNEVPRIGRSCVWTRSNPEENPRQWEIDLGVSELGNAIVVREIQVETLDRKVRKTPLVWWSGLSGYSWKSVGWNGWWYFVTSETERREATFDFGDSKNGWDPGTANWPGNVHTGVSFIPRVRIGDFSEGQGSESGEQPPRYPPFEVGSSGTWTQHYVFQQHKGACYTYQISWNVGLADLPDDRVGFLLGEAGGVRAAPAFLSGFEFERDYIGDELKEITERKIVAPQYRVRMMGD